jgi:multidrug resistance efflux pump
MITVMTIVYVALIVLVFKILKVKPSPWPIAAFVVLGVALIGSIVVLWTLAAPISSKAVVSRYVVSIVPWVKGRIISIPALPNVPLHKGDVLYEIDPAPYQYTVNQIASQLQAAKSNAAQFAAAVDVAAASVDKAKADVTAKKAAFEVAKSIDQQNAAAISRLRLVEARETYAAAEAALTQAGATRVQAEAALASAKDSIMAIEAQLASAKFDLQQTKVTAPADGFVTNWEIRAGTFVVPMPFAAAGTFIDTSQTMIVAPFPAQMLIHVKPEQNVELAFKNMPGRLYRGKVDSVLQATGEGQFTTSGKLPSAASIGSPGMLAVKIRLDDDQSADELELGSAGSVAIYTDWGKPFAMMSKVTIRLKKWLYFLPIP